jgi:hypothetical protein
MPQEPTIEARIALAEKRLDAVELAIARLTPVAPVYGVEIVDGLRTLNEDFIVSTVRDARVSYTLETKTSATGSGANDSEALIELVVDGVTVHSARNRIVATLTAILGLLGISLNSNVQRWVLTGYARAGQTVRIATSGSGTVDLISVQEVLQ